MTFKLGKELYVKLHLNLLLGLLLFGAFFSGMFILGSNEISLINIFFGFIISFSLFASVLIHELAHITAAHFFNIKTRLLEMHLIGGSVHLENEDSIPNFQQFIIASAGPLINLIIWALCLFPYNLMLFLMSNDIYSFSIAFWQVAYLFVMIGYMNLMLSLLNLIPAIPLDGGHMLIAVLNAFNYKSLIKIPKLLTYLLVFVLLVYNILLIVSFHLNIPFVTFLYNKDYVLLSGVLNYLIVILNTVMGLFLLKFGLKAFKK